eukprot:TRINITY_DN3084_c0_g1_i1.p1 TRINITY_DN3084_c0_g1~~TRINITY_DN3084_c0_g1_i1.p1  ORF type:complete len:732 (-),score=257.77 TRINITY_DN3084_c0_g1_i1:1304-3499(-)
MVLLPSLSEISSVTELESIESLLKEVDAREKSLEQELDSLLNESQSDESKLEIFESFPIKLIPILKESKELTEKIETSCDLAESISSKVKDLDLIRNRVGQVSKRVNDILDVKNCIEGVQSAMEKEDYEGAASHIHRFLNIDPSVFEGSTSAEQLRLASSRLTEIVKKNLDDAIREEKEDEILRYCCLYIPLGQKEEGLTRYAHYLRNKAGNELDQIYKKLLRSLGQSHVAQDPEEKPINCTEAITQIFEFIADLIEFQSQLVSEKFGADSVVFVIRHLQMQTDITSTKVVDLFMETFQVSKLHEQVSNQKKVKASDKNSTKDARDIAPILEEIALMSRSVEFFDQYLRRKAKEAHDQLTLAQENRENEENSSYSSKPSGSENTAATNRKNKPDHGLLHVSELNRRMQELVGYYMMLEEYFMTESVKKAIRMDEMDEDSLNSSAVDHIFFIFQKASQRALLSSNLNALCATINMIITVISRDVKDYLQSLNHPKISFTTILNNTEECSDFILKLRKELESECMQIFKQIDVKVKSCLDDLTEASTALKKLLSQNMDEASQAVVPRVRSLFDGFSMIGYDLTEHDFAEREVNDPYVQQFIVGIESVVKPYQSKFTSSNYDNFVHNIIRFVCTKMEQELLKKKFNQLGGLQFEKELRALQGYFQGITQKTVRDKFARLTQMASLLFLEKEHEVLDFWGQNSSNVTWRLTPSEVRKVLGLRVDFSKDVIAKLKL